MTIPSLPNIFKLSIKDLVKSPIIVIPSVILAILLFIFSKSSWKVQPYLATNPLLTTWVVLFSLVAIGVMSYLFSSLIGVSKEVIENKGSFKHLYKYGNKFWLKNYPIMIVLAIVSFIVFQVAVYLALFIGKSTHLSVNSATIIFFLLLFAGLAGIIIFLTYASFELIINNKSIIGSIKSSIKTVKNNYIQTLMILVIFFVIYNLIETLANYSLIASNILEYVIFTPYLALILARFIITLNKN